MQVREMLLKKGQRRGVEQVPEDLLMLLLQRAWYQLSKGDSLLRAYCKMGCGALISR